MMKTPAYRPLAGTETTGKVYTVDNPTREDAMLIDLFGGLSERTRTAAKWVYWELLSNAHKYGQRVTIRPLPRNGVVGSADEEGFKLQLFVTRNEFGRCLRIEVHDLTTTSPRYDSRIGWGLRSVRGLTLGRCFHTETRSGKYVWAEVPDERDK
ncbi:hypothetical protein [Actinomadura violacea]|uniref:Uncharacterized protein n=1 Tax=Actinomadura violacea TaxID=2819934 RepID=A0ABS3RHQ9_9ACTN|nr:hypothetical protein [Actinomadura violacea]MBO2456269.1 hypothetical protein [Actinomadura violacea]